MMWIFRAGAAGYGCHGIANFTGSVRVEEDAGAVIASGNWLTRQDVSGHVSIPFSIAGQRPF